MLLYSCSETPLARCIFQLNIPFFISNKTNEMDVKSYINELYLINDEHPLPFHNLARTKEIVNAAKKITSHYHPMKVRFIS